MTEQSKGIREMSDAEVDAAVEAFIERESDGGGEVPADLFLDLLFDRIAAREAEPVTVAVRVTDGGLQLSAEHETGDVVVQGNEILVAGRRLVLQLEEGGKR